MFLFLPAKDRNKRTKYDLREQQRPTSYDETVRRPKRSGTLDSTLLPDDSASNLTGVDSQTAAFNKLASAFGTGNLLPVSSYKQEAASVISSLADSINERLESHGAHLKNSDLDDFKDAMFGILDKVHREAMLTIAAKETQLQNSEGQLETIQAALQSEQQIECLMDELRADSEWDFVTAPSINTSYHNITKHT